MGTKQRAGRPTHCALWRVKVFSSQISGCGQKGNPAFGAFLRSRQLCQDGLEVRDGRISEPLLYKLRRKSHCDGKNIFGWWPKRRQWQPATTIGDVQRRIESFPLLKLQSFGAALKPPTCSMLRDLSAQAVTSGRLARASWCLPTCWALPAASEQMAARREENGVRNALAAGRVMACGRTPFSWSVERGVGSKTRSQQTSHAGALWSAGMCLLTAVVTRFLYADGTRQCM